MKRRTILQAMGALVAGLVTNLRGWGGQVQQTVKRAATSPTAPWTRVTPTPVTMNLLVPDQGEYEGVKYRWDQACQKLKGSWVFRPLTGRWGSVIPPDTESIYVNMAYVPVRLTNERQTGYVVATLNNPARAPRTRVHHEPPPSYRKPDNLFGDLDEFKRS